MKPGMDRIQCVGLIALILLLAACTPGPATLQRANTVQPANTLPPTETPRTEIVDEVIDRPAMSGEPVTWPKEAITSVNAHQVSLLAIRSKGLISGLAWSPDGKTLAISSSTGIYLHEAESLEEIRKYGNGAVLGPIVYSPNGSVLAGVENTAIKLWDAASGSELHTLVGQTLEATSLALSPDGALLAAGSDYSIIKLWNASSRNEVATLKGPNENELIGQLIFSADGAKLVSLGYPINTYPGGNRGTSGAALIRIWDIASRTELRTLPNCMGYRMALSPDNRSLAVKQDYAIAICDIESGEVLNKLDVTSDSYLAYSPDGTLLAGGVDQAIKIWDAATLEEIRTIGKNQEIRSMAFSPDGRKLASATDRSVQVWDSATGQVLQTLTGVEVNNVDETPGQLGGYEGYLADMVISPDRKILATVTEGGPLKLYDTTSGLLLKELETRVGFVRRVAFSPDGKLIAVSGGRYEPLVSGVQIWDVATHELKLTLDGFIDAVNSVAFSPDGTMLATGEGVGWGYQGRVKLWNLSTGELLQEFGRKNMVDPLNYLTVYDVAFSPDGTHLAAATEKGVLLWDVSQQKEEAFLTGTAKYVMRVSFSPDGSVLASAGRSGNEYETNDFRLWDLATGKTIYILEGQSIVTSMAFNPDGRVLASASFDGSVWLWDTQTGKVLATLDGAGSHTLAFSPDGTFLATGGYTLRFWGIPLTSTYQPEITHESIGGGVTPIP